MVERKEIQKETAKVETKALWTVDHLALRKEQMLVGLRDLALVEQLVAETVENLAAWTDYVKAAESENTKVIVMAG